MHTRVVVLGDLSADELERWKSLSARAIEPNPFMDPRLLSPNGHPHADGIETRLLIVEERGVFLAVMAFQLADRRIRGLPMHVVMSSTSFLFNVTARHYPLVDATRPVDAVEGLLHGLRAHGLPGLLDLISVPKNSPLEHAFFAAAASMRIPVVERGQLDYAYCRRSDAEVSPELQSATKNSSGLRVAGLKMNHLSTSTAKRYRHRYHALERHTGGAVTMTDRSDDPAAIEEFLELQAAGWKGRADRGGGALRIVGYDAWFVETTTAFRADNDLSVFSLGSEMGTLYMAVALRSGGGLFGAQDAYDENFAQFSTGALGRLATLEYTMSNTTASFFDPNMHPKYVQSTQLYPDRRTYSTLLLATHGGLSTAVARSIPALRRLRDRIVR
jgi:hypothetical protein